jgi:threonine dehydrogenase-like Zn-dependent dehydrogenase
VIAALTRVCPKKIGRELNIDSTRPGISRIVQIAMRDSVDVLVVGAGPVGLLLACELQRLGVDYLLVEKVPERAYFCKAMGVTPRTLAPFSPDPPGERSPKP